VLPGEAAVAAAARRSLEGHSRGARRIWPFLGPAFVAAVAYIDPGNFATNIAGGAKFGYLLLWVVLAANLVAMLVQTQSAKLGIATGRNLAELCRERFSRRTSVGLWLQAELVAMATDVAEVVGAALGLNLLFGIPLFARRAITLAPALLVLAVGFNPTDALVFSQVVLSFGIPFALVPLLLIARRRDVMGALANPGWLTAVAGALAALIIGLNVFLIADLIV